MSEAPGSLDRMPAGWRLPCLVALAVLLSGCAKYVTVESSKATGRLRIVQRGNALAIEAPSPPEGHVVVKARIVQVSYPLVRSPSLVGDRASAVCRIESGIVPEHEGATHVRLRFDPDPGGIKNGNSLRKGEGLEFVFTRQGELFRWMAKNGIPLELDSEAPIPFAQDRSYRRWRTRLENPFVPITGRDYPPAGGDKGRE
jgi:hypothetical protein